MLHQQLQEGVLRFGQVDRHVPDADTVGGGVQEQVPGGEAAPAPEGGAAQLHGDPGQQLPAVKGFRYVVRRAPQEQVDLPLNVHLGAEDDHRDALELGQERFPAEAGEHQVQQHQVRGPLGEQVLGLGAGIGPQDPVALACQELFQNVTDVDVVVNDCNGLHKSHLKLAQKNRKGTTAIAVPF